jgi:ABC-type transporter Mla MlaB component
MLKISEIEPPCPTGTKWSKSKNKSKRRNHAVTLRLEGKLVGPWVTEARQACEGILNEGQRLQLSLADVDFLDASGSSLLANLRTRGVSFVDCSLFVEEQLKNASA